MPNYAVIEGNFVINTIVAESLDAAENITGKTCVEYTTEPAEPGGSWNGTVFFPRKPFNSWDWDTDKLEWVAPVPLPDQETPYLWDEDTLSWVPRL